MATAPSWLVAKRLSVEVYVESKIQEGEAYKILAMASRGRDETEVKYAIKIILEIEDDKHGYTGVDVILNPLKFGEESGLKFKEIDGLFSYLRKIRHEKVMKELAAAEETKLKEILEEYLLPDEEYSIAFSHDNPKIINPAKEECSFLIQLTKRDKVGVPEREVVEIKIPEMSNGIVGLIKVGEGLKQLREKVLLSNKKIDILEEP